MASAIDLSALNSLKGATSYISTSLHDAVKLRIGKQGLSAIQPQTIPQFFRECCRKYNQLPALVYDENATQIINKTTTTTTINTTAAAETTTNSKEVDKDNKNKATNISNENCNNSCPNSNSSRTTQNNATQSTISASTAQIWRTYTFNDYERKVEEAALILLHVGLQPRSSVGILSFNCPEWFFVELGALRAGGIVAGIYPSNSAEAVFHVLNTSEATVCVVDDDLQMAKVRSVKMRLPRLRAVVQLHGPFADFIANEEDYYRWDELMHLEFTDSLREELEIRERDIGANECSMLIYTSGTVGMPKAVMISHDAVIYDAKIVSETLKQKTDYNENERDTVISYLPLNHVAAQVFDIFVSLESGTCVYFADRNALKGSLTKTLQYVRPTRFFGVPRIFEKMQESLNFKETQLSAFSRYIMEKSREKITDYNLKQLNGKPTSFFKYWLATLAIRKVKVALGFDRCKVLMIGGAPVFKDLKLYFLSLDMLLHDIYGLSECSGAITLNIDLQNIESVGKAFDSIECKVFNPDSNGHGEICIRGRTNLMGYLNEIEKTNETIKDDGWLHSGDIGYLDTSGNLVISGRLKELIITAGGENIPPVHIEELVKSELPGISFAMVVGDHKKYLTILLTIQTQVNNETGLPTDFLGGKAVEWMNSLGLTYTRLSEVLDIPADIKELDASNIEVKAHAKVLQSIQEGIKRANEHSISSAQKVQKFALLPHEFSIQTGELGPTLKLRRNIVLQKYANIIEQMYSN